MHFNRLACAIVAQKYDSTKIPCVELHDKVPDIASERFTHKIQIILTKMKTRCYCWNIELVPWKLRFQKLKFWPVIDYHKWFDNLWSYSKNTQAYHLRIHRFVSISKCLIMTFIELITNGLNSSKL